MRGWTGTNNIQFQSEMLATMGFDEALRTNTETAGHCRIAEDRVTEHLSCRFQEFSRAVPAAASGGSDGRGHDRPGQTAHPEGLSFPGCRDLEGFAS